MGTFPSILTIQTPEIRVQVSHCRRCYYGIADQRCICDEPRCQDGLDCTLQPNQSVCICDSGYTGLKCESPEQCNSHNCRHGHCLQDDSLCQCDAGFTGESYLAAAAAGNAGNDSVPLSGYWCEEQIDECEPQPCKNNGSCYDLLGDYICKCLPGTLLLLLSCGAMIYTLLVSHHPKFPYLSLRECNEYIINHNMASYVALYNIVNLLYHIYIVVLLYHIYIVVHVLL